MYRALQKTLIRSMLMCNINGLSHLGSHILTGKRQKHHQASAQNTTNACLRPRPRLCPCGSCTIRPKPRSGPVLSTNSPRRMSQQSAAAGMRPLGGSTSGANVVCELKLEIPRAARLRPWRVAAQLPPLRTDAFNVGLDKLDGEPSVRVAHHHAPQLGGRITAAYVYVHVYAYVCAAYL